MSESMNLKSAVKNKGGEGGGFPQWTKTIIFFVVMFGFGFLPAPAPMTHLGMNAVGIFLAMIYGWTAIGMIWPSIAGILAMALLGVMPLGQVLSSGWGGGVVTLLLFMMMIAKNLEKSGISKFIALWFVSRRVVRGRPFVLLFFFLAAVALVSSLTSAVAMVFLGWIILQDVLSEAKIEKFESFATFSMIGVVMASCLGNGLFSFRTVGAVAFGVMSKVSGVVLNDFVFAAWEFAMCFLLLAAYVLLGKFVFRCNADKVALIDGSYFDGLDLSLDRSQKVILALMVLLVVVMLGPSVLPKDSAVYALLSSLGSNGAAALICLLMCIIRVDGEALMEPKSVIREGVSFDVLFLGAAVLPLALGTFSSSDAGISAFLSQSLSPLVQGQSGIAFLILAALIAVILTNFINNVTVPAILYPAFYPIASAVGIGPVELMCVIVFACGLSFLLPSACPMAAVMFGNGEWIKKKDIYLYAGSFLAVCFAALCLSVPIVQVIFP